MGLDGQGSDLFFERLLVRDAVVKVLLFALRAQCRVSRAFLVDESLAVVDASLQAGDDVDVAGPRVNVMARVLVSWQ